MIKNYLLIAFRNFLRNKVYSLINVVGLAISIASSALLFIYVFNELTYNKIHPHHEELYSLGIYSIDKNGNKDSYGMVPGGWAVSLKDKFEGIKDFTRINLTGYPHSIHDKQTDRIILTHDGELLWVENTLGDIMHLQMRDGGEVHKALEHINSMIISTSAAKSLFGEADPLNRLVTIRHPNATLGRDVEYVITGIFEDNPANTFFRPKYLLNILGVKTLFEQAGTNFNEYIDGSNLSSGFFFAYLRMPNASQLGPIQAELDKLASDAVRKDSVFQASGSKLSAVIKPFDEMHFDTQFNWAVFEQSGNLQVVMILAGIGILILVIASINYMNLATARSRRRGKEVGLRKTLGSSRMDLIFQFMQESAVTTFISFLFAGLLINVSLPYFNQIADKHFVFSDLFNLYFLSALLAIVLIVTILGGSYPAFYLSSFNPASVLKGGGAIGQKSEVLRKGLVTFQFCFAVLLTISSIVIMQQMELIQKSKLNENGGQILCARYGSVAPNEKYPVLKNELLKGKELSYVTMASHLPRHDYFGGMENRFRAREINNQEYFWSCLNTDFDFCKTFDVKIISGRDFDEKIRSDSNAVLLNERAVKVLNRTTENIIGMEIENVNIRQRSRVIGVVKDFPFQSAYHAINPLVISPQLSDQDRILYIKLPADNVGDRIKSIEAKWKNIMPGIGFEYWFVDDEFGRLYKKEKQVSNLTEIFALVSLCVTILGLYGLASYMAEQKTKEIGIRKTLGASVSQVLSLFIIEFLKVFFFASLVALPVAWYFSDRWLQSFIYRIELKPVLFLTGVAFVFGLMIITVIYQVIKAARSNPVNALKHE